jgi:hypothetical protein
MTLDFIPGGNFYGIVANHLYKLNGKGELSQDVLWNLVHSGKARYGDAHLVIKGERSFHVPASMYYPKLKGLDDTRIHHKVYDILQDSKKVKAKDKKDKEKLLRSQLKQCRSGYYVVDGNKCVTCTIDKSFALKSAHDHDMRRSKDSQMYGYESLSSGITLEFSVYYEDELQNDIHHVTDALKGNHRIGRSRTAQYGEVNIALKDEDKEVEAPEINGKEVLVYADARLIFLDENGLPTFIPKPSDFGLDDETDKIVWEKSQLRTFQYAPWNFKRQSFDTDRCGLEKGSVIYILRANDEKITLPPFVGSYQLEGFGHVRYNPNFLQPKKGDNIRGAAAYPLDVLKNDETPNDDNQSATSPSYSTPLLEVLRNRKQKSKNHDDIYNKTNEFVDKYKSLFCSEQSAFASQWGNIRSLAMSSKNAQDLKSKVDGYLTHGVAAQKWKEMGRLDKLDKFMDEVGRLDKLDKFMDEVDDDKLIEAVINLSAEMGKVCSKNEKKGGE